MYFVRIFTMHFFASDVINWESRSKCLNFYCLPVHTHTHRLTKELPMYNEIETHRRDSMTSLYVDRAVTARCKTRRGNKSFTFEICLTFGVVVNSCVSPWRVGWQKKKKNNEREREREIRTQLVKQHSKFYGCCRKSLECGNIEQ